MTTPSSEGFTTTDLSLVAFLIQEGCKPTERFLKETLKSGYPIGGWVFKDDIKRVHELVVRWNEDKAPQKKYHQVLAKERSAMYDFLGIKKGN